MTRYAIVPVEIEDGALLLCPFCGGTAERIDIEDGDNAGGSLIGCTVCQASSNVEFEFKENFVSNWNRRYAPSPLDDAALVERVAKALCKLEGAKWDAEHFGETMTGNTPSEMQDGYRDQARAAIAAIIGGRE